MAKEASWACPSGKTCRWRVDTTLAGEGRRERGARTGLEEGGRDEELTKGGL